MPRKLLDYEYKEAYKQIPGEEEDDLAKAEARAQKGIHEDFSRSLTKRKGKRKGHRKPRTVLPYLILPRWKRLSKKVILKLEKENARYKLSQAINAAKRLEEYAKPELDEIGFQPDRGELEWKDEVRWGNSATEIINNRIFRLERRERKRRQKLEQSQREELQKRRYRVNPRDPNYDYVPGYQRKRHRITKERFFRCVNIELFNDVVNSSKDLIYSPLWKENLNLDNINAQEAKLLKDHLCQFEVIVECLKQGVFDRPEVDNIPLKKVARAPKKWTKQKQDNNIMNYTERFLKMSKYKHNEADKKIKANNNKSKIKKAKEFPPYKNNSKYEDGKKHESGWLNKVTDWLKKNPDVKGKNEKIRQDHHQENETHRAKTLEEVKEIFKTKENIIITTTPAKEEKPKVDDVPNPKKPNSFTAISVKSSSSFFDSQHMSKGRDYTSAVVDRMSRIFTPFSNFLYVKIPKDLAARKNLIHSLADAKKKSTKKPHLNEVEQAQKFDLRKAHVEKRDPLQRLHEDEKDSDIWTNTDTTTTDDYASWRRLPAAIGKKEILTGVTKKTDNSDPTFPLRMVLMLIVLWEIGVFVKRVIDDVYYNAFTFHLYRENIWLSGPHISTPEDTYALVAAEDWIHQIISIISLSIIEKKNECVSLLFAFSLLIHSCIDIGKQAHDSIYATTEEGNAWKEWKGLSFLFLNILFKSIRICLFIAYHYCCADYIRKSREFRHRRTKLHNQEICAKGTKGLMKRRLAWRWMTRHSRFQALKAMKKKYPDVKDGNFPEHDLDHIVNFLEAKELRLYAQQHNLKLGYPYNSLKDMKQHVFGETEASDYNDEEVEEEMRKLRIKTQRFARRRSTAPLTVEKWQKWRSEQPKKTEGKAKKVVMAEEPQMQQEKLIPQQRKTDQTQKQNIKSHGLTLGTKLNLGNKHLKY